MRNLRNVFAGIAFLAIQPNLNAQQWDWASQVGKDFVSDSYEPQVRTNSAGDLFTSGTFQNFAKLGDTIFYVDSSFYLNRGNYVARLNSASQLIWAQFIGGQNTSLIDLSIDKNNNTYVVGVFVNDLILNDTTLTNAGDYESFIVAFDALGHRKWLKRYPSNIILNYIVNDGNNDLIYAYSTPFSTVPVLGVGKISPAGTSIWSKTYLSSAALKGLRYDSNNAIYLAATFDGDEFKVGTTVYYQGTGYPSSSCLIKINDLGMIKNVEIIRGALLLDFDLDAQDNIYTLGSYDKAMKVRQFSFAVPGTCLPPVNCEEFFIAKLNTQGSASWARKKKSDEPLVLKSLTVSENGNFYIAGAFKETLFFDTVSLTESENRSAVFVYKFNTNGFAQWAEKNSGGNLTDCFAYDIAYSENRSIYLSGNFHNFNNNCWFGNDTLPQTGFYTHIFLAKMIDSQVECVPPPAPSASNKTICSGNTTTLSAIGIGTIGWYSSETAGTYLGGGAHYTTPVLTANAAYYVQDSTCAPSSARKAVLVTVNPLPIVTANASATTVCAGTVVTLTGGGAISYAWTGSVINGIGFIPATTTTYTVTGTDVNNCSNTATATINVNPLPDVSISLSGATISANQNGALYQWLDCNNGNSPIAEATDQNYTATVNGHYAVIVSMNNCSDTSTCVNVNITGINETVENYDQFTVIPNPSNGALTVTLSGVEGQSTSEGVYTIMNESGQQIQLFELNSGNKFTINIEDLSNGIYFIVGFNNDQMIRQKVVVAQ